MPKIQETTLEIDLNALKHNYNYLKSKTEKHTKFLAVAKAYAYGHNTEPLALYLENELDVDYFAVAYAYEGVSLRQSGITKPILVLHPLASHFNVIITHCLEPALYSYRILNEFTALAKEKQQKHYPIHLKFNTGLNRLGFSKNDAIDVVNTINKTPSVKIASILSHLAASEDSNEKEFSQQQIHCFVQIKTIILNELDYKPLLHLCNTSGILNYPEAHFDMVRSGIGLFGFGNDSRFKNDFIPVATLKTIISQIHTVNKGDSLGYNRKFIAPKKTRTATLPLGHADGLSRIYGKETGYVFINNQKAKILGNTCMDMIMVDITEIPCNEGDEVIVFGKSHSAEDLAESAGTISYELLTDMSQRIKRVVYR